MKINKNNMSKMTSIALGRVDDRKSSCYRFKFAIENTSNVSKRKWPVRTDILLIKVITINYLIIFK